MIHRITLPLLLLIAAAALPYQKANAQAAVAQQQPSVGSESGGSGKSSSTMFIGAGLDYFQTNLYQTKTVSRFRGFGWQVHGGIDILLISRIALHGMAFIGSQSFDNIANSQAVSESGENSNFGLRAGFYLGTFGFGGGLRKNNFTVETFPSGSPSRKIEFAEAIPFLWAAFTYQLQGRVGFTLDSEYHFGNFTDRNYRYSQYGLGLKRHLYLK